MELTLKQAADRLGKSTRQVRYLIDQGKLSAAKVEGRWVIELDQLPLSPGREAAKQRTFEALDTQVKRAAEAPSSTSRRFSVRDIKAYQFARPLYARVLAHHGAAHPSTRAMFELLLGLTRGCHRFAWPHKAVAYSEARDAASLAVCLLLLEDDTSEAIATELEQAVMPAVSGLIRRVERKAQR